MKAAYWDLLWGTTRPPARTALSTMRRSCEAARRRWTWAAALDGYYWTTWPPASRSTASTIPRRCWTCRQKALQQGLQPVLFQQQMEGWTCRTAAARTIIVRSANSRLVTDVDAAAEAMRRFFQHLERRVCWWSRSCCCARSPRRCRRPGRVGWSELFDLKAICRLALGEVTPGVRLANTHKIAEVISAAAGCRLRVQAGGTTTRWYQRRGPPQAWRALRQA